MITMNAWTSLTVFIRESVELFVAAGMAPTMEIVDWEAASDIKELPAVDLLGLVSFSLDEESQNIWRVQFAIGLSTFDDPSLFRHRKIMAHVFEKVRTGMKLPVYDAETGEITSWMKILDGTSLAPVSNTQVRGFQFVSAEALLDPCASK